MFTLNRVFVFLTFSVVMLGGCAGLGTPGAPKSDEVTVARIGADRADKPPIKRQQLENEIMRFGDRYAARMALEADRIRENATTLEQQRIAVGWKLACNPQPDHSGDWVRQAIDLHNTITVRTQATSGAGHSSSWPAHPPPQLPRDGGVGEEFPGSVSR